jgi:ribonucleoside-diphosphate reductase beta chain
MMLISFANMEAIHVAAYDRLNTSLNLPDAFYGEFLKVGSMYAKYDYMQEFDVSSPQKVALTLAIVSGFIEGVVLFASFAIIVSFSSVRNSANKSNVMFGTGQIVSMSMGDESLHALGILRLFHEYVDEHKDQINIELLYKEIEENCYIIMKNEMAFIDTVYNNHELEYLPKKSLKAFVLYMINLRLHSLQMPSAQITDIINQFKQIYNIIIDDISSNPLKYMEDRYNFGEIVNFFETTATAYHKGLEAEEWI